MPRGYRRTGRGSGRRMTISNRISWDDLRIICEVARQGSIHGAAKALRLDHSTVTRRVSQIELLLQRRLFDRSNRGVSVRPEATELIKHVRSMEYHAAAVHEEMGRVTEGQTRPVRIASMEGIASCYLAPRIDRIRRADPRLQIELFSNPHIVDLLRKETDLFISFFNPETAGLISRKIGECAIYVYGSRNYEKQSGIPKNRAELRNHRFVSYIAEMVTIESVRWLEEIVPDPNVVFASNSVIAQSNAAVSGVGLVVLPTFVGSQTPLLFRVLPEEVVVHRPIWLSVTCDQSELPSIRSAATIITDLFSADGAYLIGHGSYRE
jgi:DNA-binding transcriptional LysR family regulator